MTREGAMAVVLTPDGRQVLLLRRQFLFLWDLPGGGVESGESPAAAAARETLEETGCEIVVERCVGSYRHPSVYGRGDQVTRAFRARRVGGTLRRFGGETLGLRWCDVAALPRGLEGLQRLMIADALPEAAQPVERRVAFPWWKLVPARAAFMALRAVRTALGCRR